LRLAFRQGNRSDLDAVYELNRHVFPESWSYDGLRDALKGGYELLLCMDGKKLAGYLLSHVVIDEVHIMQVAVAPEYRRQGIAEQLSRQLMAAKPDHLLMLEVRASNHAAQSLYAKLGFVRSGLRKGYYVSQQNGGPQEDAVLMRHQSD
jgi:ribosomal-protein-alanine N-acetyltransferase